MTKFETWWHSEGSEMRPHDGEDIEEFAKRMTQIAWSNAEYLAQSEQKRPQNCGTGYCSCIECVMEPEQTIEQAQKQEPVAYRSRMRNRDGQVITGWVVHLDTTQNPDPRVEIEPLYTSTTPQRQPQFREFIKWAGAQGYDCGQTCNSDTGEWICLHPMTADLWKCWQAAHGIK